MCDLESIGSPSIFKTICSATALARIPELLKLQKSGQFPDDPVKIEGAQIHSEDTQTY